MPCSKPKPAQPPTSATGAKKSTIRKQSSENVFQLAETNWYFPMQTKQRLQPCGIKRKTDFLTLSFDWLNCLSILRNLRRPPLGRNSISRRGFSKHSHWQLIRFALDRVTAPASQRFRSSVSYRTSACTWHVCIRSYQREFIFFDALHWLLQNFGESLFSFLPAGFCNGINISGKFEYFRTSISLWRALTLDINFVTFLVKFVLWHRRSARLLSCGNFKNYRFQAAQPLSTVWCSSLRVYCHAGTNSAPRYT